MDQPDIEYGNDCLLKFEPGQTPKYAYARFSKIKTCPPPAPTAPNDRVFKLTQDPELPCCWEYITSSWYISFEYLQDPDISRLFAINQDHMIWYFFNAVDGHVDEGHVFHNDNVECFWDIGGIEGIATVTWDLESLKLMELLNIKAAEDLFMEMRPLEDGSKVYKYCNLKDATNIAIKFEP
ncbi:unnamed protein product [marine sediment metagenome]|uniref:Uncharacterized protein n=1 Tax=marine sediment metagenome TaxID=412755 RepID=X1F8K9_9ZZZZ